MTAERNGAAHGAASQSPSTGSPPPPPRPHPCHRYPAARGTIAVLLGYFTHVEPLGTLRWGTHAALIGALCALPMIFIDGLIMLPNWEAQRTTREVKVLVPQDLADELAKSNHSFRFGEKGVQEASTTGDDAAPAAAAATATAVAERNPPAAASSSSSSAGDGKTVPPGMVQMERTLQVRADQHPLRDALHRAQVERAMNNVGRLLSPPSEFFLLLMVHISEEMLYRGVLLVLVVRWTTDRLYEAGADDVVRLAGGLEVTTPQLGAVLAAVAMTTAAVGLLVQRELFPIRILKAAGKMAESDEKGAKKLPGGATVNEVLEKVRDSVLGQQRWAAASTAVGEFVQWTTLSAVFLGTGNILAPVAAAVVADATYSVMQHRKAGELQREMRQSLKDRAQQMRDTKVLLDAVKARQKDSLAPPAAAAAEEEEGTTEEEG